MQRPHKDDYKFEWHHELVTYNYNEYEYDLEKYCSELERLLEGHDILVQVADDLLADNRYLNKKLDKACDELAKHKQKN